MVAIFPGARMSLKIAPRGTEIFYQQQTFGGVHSNLSLDCTHMTIPLSREPLKVSDSLPETERSFLAQSKETSYTHRPWVSDWQHAELILIKSILNSNFVNFVQIIPSDINHCPSLGLRLDLHTLSSIRSVESKGVHSDPPDSVQSLSHHLSVQSFCRSF